MAKKYSDYPVPGFGSNWGENPTDHLPQSGEQVNTFIDRELANATRALYWDDGNSALLLFRSTADKDMYVEDPSRTELIMATCPVNLSGEQHRVLLINNNGSLVINAAMNQTVVNIDIDFDVQRKLITEESWESTGQGAWFTLYIDAGSTGNFVEVDRVFLTAGVNYLRNVREYLVVGTNRVRVVADAESYDNCTSTLTYQVNMAEMYIEEFQNGWYNAIVEGEPTNYKLGGFKIVGGLSKTLHIELFQGQSMIREFVTIIGTSSYVDTPYFFTAADGLDMSGLATGIYILKAYLTAGSLTSLPVTYNIMYVAAADVQTAQLVCVNGISPVVSNYATSDLCRYAIYDRGYTSGTPHVKIQLVSGTTPTTKVDQDYTGITVGVEHTLAYTLEWLIETTINIWVRFELTLGDSMQTAAITIDNSATYPAETGAIFYLNVANRSNGDADRESVHNEAATPVESIPSTWQKMSWVDGIDGWTQDENGRKALSVPAGSRCTIPYSAFTGDNITVELCYRVANVSDYDENIITMAENPTDPGFTGLRIRPTNITVHSSSDTTAGKDVERGTNLEDEQTVHLLLVIQRDFGGNTGKNLVTGYVNACKNFQFSYTSGTIWANDGDIILGSDTADLYLYSMRVYDKVLGVKSAEQNYINSLPQLADRAAAAAFFNSIVNENTHEMTYEKVVNSDRHYNFFVVEMLNGATIPSKANGWSKDSPAARANMEMHFGAHPAWDFKLYNVETSGQGTTSMDYWRWNLRFRIDKSNNDKKVNVAYYDDPTTAIDGSKIFNELPASLSKVVFFDGGSRSDQQHPAVKRITAKINSASSMQSHKMGATWAYTQLHDAIGLANEAQAYADEHDLPRPVVSVYQYPAFGFAKTVSPLGVATYEFIGLFTIGPDKGDKPSFGYDIDSSISDSLITLEGTDHSRYLAKFCQPWNEAVRYLAENECLNIVKGIDDYDNAWEVSNCHGLSTDEAADQAAIEDILETEFKPAYDLAYGDSTMIFPVALDDETWGGVDAAAVLANINADVDAFRAAQYNERLKNADMEFWIEDEYILYHYSPVTGLFVAGQDLAEQCGEPEGDTVDEQNEFFKAARRAHFLANAPTVWNIKDAIYHFVFLVIFGATDNFAKNSYPYKMKTIDDGGKWCWRQDDLDSLFDIDNLGSQTKPYFIEFPDGSSGAPYFAGSNSVFWNLLFETFYDNWGVNKGIQAIGRDVITAMANAGGGSNIYEGCLNFVKALFWDKAQSYFPASAYNIDASWKYEAAWLAGDAKTSLAQSLGNHFPAEREWVSRRVIYCMSLFKAGPFATSSDGSLGTISFRPQSYPTPQLTPALDMYPAISNGTDSPVTTGRTKAGQTHEFNMTLGDGNTTVYIQASDWLTKIGNLKDLVLGAQYVSETLNIRGKRLREFLMGDETAGNVSTNVQAVAFPNNRCLEKVDVRNAASLIGSVDLSECRRLLEAYFEGTGVALVRVAQGSKVTTLHLGEDIRTIELRDLKFLADLDLPEDTSAVQSIRVERCTNQQGITMLEALYDEEGAIQYIRIIWDGTVNVDADTISMLGNIAVNKKKDGTTMVYHGIDVNGGLILDGRPVIEGILKLTAGLYSEDLQKIGIDESEPYGEGLVIARSSTFGALSIIYNPALTYISFADDTVKNIVLSNWGTDGYITLEQAAAVTDLARKFNGNTSIVYFNEFKHFTGVTRLGAASAGTNGSQFAGCTGLKEITFPDSLTTIGSSSFDGCSSLEKVFNYQNIINLYTQKAFSSCAMLRQEFNFPKLTHMGHSAFFKSGITGFEAPLLASVDDNSSGNNGGCFNTCANLRYFRAPHINRIVNNMFDKCSALEEVSAFDSVTGIGSNAFYNCTSLTELVFSSPNVISLANINAFGNTNAQLKIYVPDELYNDYLVATNWSNASIVGKIHKMSELPE